MSRALVIIGFLFVASLTIQAEEEKKSDSTWTQAQNIIPMKPSAVDSATHVDTIYYSPGEVPNEIAQVTNPINFEEHLTQQPTIALFKSMLVPGWGQIGNGKYLKAGVIIGLEVWLLSEAMRYGGQAADEWDLFEAESDPYLRDVYYDRYQDKRSQRNKYTWFSGIVIFASMFDAYVDAHLSGAPDQVKVSGVDLDITPDTKGGVSANLSIRF